MAPMDMSLTRLPDRKRELPDDGREKTLLPYYLYQNPFFTPAVELPVEYLLPCSEVQCAACYGHDHLSAHDSPLQVGVPVVLAGVVVPVPGYRLVRGKPFEPYLEIVVQTGLV